LTAGDEIVAVENLDILRSNGFEVEIDEDQVPGRGERIKLSAMPVSKETTFDFKGEYPFLSSYLSDDRPRTAPSPTFRWFEASRTDGEVYKSSRYVCHASM